MALLGFSKNHTFCYKIRIFDNCLNFKHFACNRENNVECNVMAEICAKLENNLDSTSFSRELP